MWTLTGGILGKQIIEFFPVHPKISGPWIFLAMAFLFLVNLTVVTIVTKAIGQATEEDQPESAKGSAEHELVCLKTDQALTEASEEDIYGEFYVQSTYLFLFQTFIHCHIDLLQV